MFSRFARVFAENLPHYDSMLRPMRYNPGLKYEEYYFFSVFTMFLYKETGGIIYDSDKAILQGMLVAFIDQIVDDPGMGFEIAYRVGMYVFRGVACEVPPEIRKDAEHVRSVLKSSRHTEELFRYMVGLGEIEKSVIRCKRDSDFFELRIQSQCKTLWGMCEWDRSETVYALACASVILDDVLDLATDERVYISKDNLGHYASKFVACLGSFNKSLAYDMGEYFDLFGCIVRLLARLSLENPRDVSRALGGARVLALSLFVLALIGVNKKNIFLTDYEL